jgi:hypothetical protein
MQETRSFVVHVLAVGDRALAERFSKIRPPTQGPFDRLEVDGVTRTLTCTVLHR